MAIRVLAADIDGTLTINRESTIIPPGVVSALRDLEEHGVMVVLVSSNTLPIVIGLKKYFGLSGPAIGESGALVYFGGNRIEHLTKYTAREAAVYVEEHYGDCLYPSWQNIYRLHDYAFRVRDECKGVISRVLERVRSDLGGKYPFVKVGYSGYAVHLTPMDTSKAKALEYISGKLGIPLSEFAAIGDSEMDREMIETVGLGVAVSNADQELKEAADLVTENPSGYGFIELAEKIIRGEISV